MIELTPNWILGIIGAYFLMLLGVSWLTGRENQNEVFFLAGRKSPWFVVAFGMIGASLSGVTFISIPGLVGTSGVNMAFSYMQIVLGYLLGYAVIAFVLLPLYYRLQLTSIYTWLEGRFGMVSYKTGASFFLVSRTVGAAFRLFLVAMVLQRFVLGPMGIPFFGTVAATIVLIWVYTFRAGLKTIIWTDTLQTFFMLAAVVLTIFSILSFMEKGFGEVVELMQSSGYSKVFFTEGGWSDPNFFLKQIVSGALITIVMTGLDQDMMQKNLSCRSLGEAQKNMVVFAIVLVGVNLVFLSLGALLYLYAGEIGLPIPEQTDQLYPIIALEHLSPIIGIAFIIGLIAAAYSSADSALTALTTSFCIDILGFERRHQGRKQQQRIRTLVHIGFSLLLFGVILGFHALNDDAVINNLFRAASYTYGPLLGLYTFGLLTSLQVRDKWVVLVCLAAPVVSYALDTVFKNELGLNLGFLVLALNGMLTFFGLLAISYQPVIPPRFED